MFQQLLDADCEKMDLTVFMVEQALARFLRLADRNLSQAHFILRNCLGTPKATLARRYLETQPHHPSEKFFPYLQPFHESPRNPYGYSEKPPWPTETPNCHDRKCRYETRSKTTRRGQTEEQMDIVFVANTRETIIAELDEYFGGMLEHHDAITLRELERFEEYVTKGMALEND